MSQPARTPTRNPYTAPPKHRFGATAWTALVLALAGLGGAFLPILSTAAVIAAFIGLVLGVIALFGGRKLVAGLAAVLCALAIGTGVALRGAELSRSLLGAEPPPSGAPPAPAVRLPFGQAHTWPDGRSITIMPPVAYEETSEFSRPPEGKRHVQFDVVVHNGGPDAYSAVTATITVAHNGRPAQQHFGAGDPIPVEQIPPGGSAHYTAVFEIGAEPGELQVSVLPSFAAEDAVHFTGAS